MSTVDRRTSTNTFGMVRSTTWLEFKDMAQDPLIWSVGSWQVFHIVGLCVFSHQSADYSIVVTHLTSRSF
jgi:hypothetical protein